MLSRVPSRASAPTTEEDIYPTRSPSSIIRYDRSRVIQRGNQQLVIHQGMPRKKYRWLVPGSAGATLALLLILVVGAVSNWWNDHQADAKYGYPRTYQVDAVVGHGDSEDHPSHFQFENLRGHVIIIEISGGDPAHSHIYTGPTLIGDNADKTPVTGELSDETGRGTIDMVVIVGGQRIVFLNDGAQFKPPQQ